METFMYAKIIDDQPVKFPYTLVDLRKDNPSTSFPESMASIELASYNVVPVQPTEPPKINHFTQTLSGETITFIDGKWRQQWVVTDMPIEQASSNVRDVRDGRLKQSDWTQLSDVPFDSTPWATYRQALRDITLQPGFPHNVTWPKEPTT